VQKLEQLVEALQETLGVAASIQEAAKAVAAVLIQASEEAKIGVSGLGAGWEKLARLASAVTSSLQNLDSAAQRASRSVTGAADNVGSLSDALVKDIKGVASGMETVRIATAELVDLARNELAKTA
jgi:hypothetical protein